jgi:hypothetical protein
MAITLSLVIAQLSCFAALGQVLSDNLTSVPAYIEIKLPNGSINVGSGIFLYESNKLFLATAGHVLFVENSDSTLLSSNASISFIGSREPRERCDIELNPVQLSEGGAVKRHPKRDIAVVKIGTTRFDDITSALSFLPGVKANYTNTLFVTLESNCSFFSDVFQGDETYTFGYPKNLLVYSDLVQVDFEQPLVRHGIIAQKNPKTGNLILDSAVYGGNSGGPVLIRRPGKILGSYDFRVVGLVTQTVPARYMPTNIVNSGYAVVEPIDYAFKLMRQIH